MIVKASGSIELLTKLHSDIFNTDRYLLNGVDINIKLIKNTSDFCLMHEKVANAKIRIDQAILILRKAKISPTVMNAHYLTLEKATAKYPVKRCIVNTYTITKDVQNYLTPPLSNGVLPFRVVAGLVESEAYNGSPSKNPYNFQHFYLRSISLSLDSKNLPYFKALEMDYESDKYVRAYNTLFEGIDGPTAIYGNGISREEYPNGYCLYAFNLAPDSCSSDNFNVLKTGNLVLDLSFSKSLTKPVMLIVFMEYDNMLEINKSRKIFKDYQI